jgi:hypothetical protein
MAKDACFAKRFLQGDCVDRLQTKASPFLSDLSNNDLENAA